MEIAPGLELLPGDDGVLPDRVRWVAAVGKIDAVAVDPPLVYVAGDALTAVRLGDGSVAWETEHPEGFGLEASGGVVIGLDGPDRVRVFAPWEYDLRAERATGRFVSLEDAWGDLPADFIPFPQPPPTRVRVQADLEETIAYRPDGRVAWRLRVRQPEGFEQPPVEVDETIVYGTSSWHLVALDPAGEVPPARGLTGAGG